VVHDEVVKRRLRADDARRFFEGSRAQGVRHELNDFRAHDRLSHKTSATNPTNARASRQAAVTVMPALSLSLGEAMIWLEMRNDKKIAA